MTRQYQTSATSRERNRIHARKTRQRKKEQMQVLTSRADELKQEQIRLKQSINEKNTASILVRLFASEGKGGEQQVEDPRVEALLKRPSDDIPDAAKLPELPALILPGQHNSKKHKATGNSGSSNGMADLLPDDGIDYDLLGKDRSKCSPAELDQIRRERNRMHAKRTRDRKRLFMEEMAEMCKQLEEENDLLQDHLDGLNGRTSKRKERTASVISPDLSSTRPELAPSELTMPSKAASGPSKAESKSKEPVSQHGVTFDQMKTLLEAASTFSSAVSESTIDASSDDSSHDENNSTRKRRRLNGGLEVSSSHVPQTITATSPPTAVGC